MTLYESIPSWITDILDHLNTKKMCKEIIRIKPEVFFLIPNHFKTKDICNEAVHKEPHSLAFVPGHFKPKRCVAKHCACIHTYWSMSLITLNHKICVKKPLKKGHGY